MSKILRALLISAAATGVAAVVLQALKSPTPPPTKERSSDDPYVDTDALTEEQRDLLMQEMETHVNL